jgi:hypothetical protein
MLEAVFQSVVAYDRMAAMIKPYIGYSGSTQNQSEVVQGRFRIRLWLAMEGPACRLAKPTRLFDTMNTTKGDREW